MSEDEFDVVVVGGGGSGLAAAVAAASCGARTVVVEKGARLQGTTGLAVGSITANGSRMQRRAGIADSPAEHLDDYRRIAGARASRDDPDLARLFTENVGATVDWLEGMGIEFFGPNQEPPHRKPRMHNVLPSARSYIYHLSRRGRRLGVDIRLATRALRLTMTGGRIDGVIVEAGGKERHIRARRGVVLAGGDFANSPEFRREFFGDRANGYAAVNPLATGDCQRMAREIGAVICNGDAFDGAQLRFVPPPRESLLLKIPPYRLFARPMRWALDRLPGFLIRPFALRFVTTYLAPDQRLFESGALLVDPRGERVAQVTQWSSPGEAPVVKTDTYVILDAALCRKFSAYPYYIATAPNVAFAYLDDFRRNRADIFHQASDLDTLAGRLRIPAETLRRTVEVHNQAARDAAHRASAQAAGPSPLTEPPFVALGPVRPYILTTHGGLRVSTRLEVLDRDGRPIPGLFAAGGTGRGSLVLPGHGHALGWAFTSGRIAGRHAAENG